MVTTINNNIHEMLLSAVKYYNFAVPPTFEDDDEDEDESEEEEDGE